MIHKIESYFFTLLLLISTATFTQAQTPFKPDTTYFSASKWRQVSPYRGGRSAAVTGVTGNPDLFYFGATGGGVWRTEDGGMSWENISDPDFGGSIGAVAVSEYDNNVIYVGGGEKTVRGNVSHGNGMWKSLDAGKTWKKIGLEDSRHITRIRIHPKNPDLVYAAVLGHLFGSNEERGVYRSKDGGKTWERILFSSKDAGAIDLILDPTNPRVIYASTWKIRRTPYSLESGGEGSALWKSTDGGDTWKNLSKESSGLPKGTLGIMGVTVSPAKKDRVWAIIEAKDGGVFRSENGGETWAKVNDERKLRQRAWYYTRIYAHPTNPEGVYVLNVNFHFSSDGGKSYERIETPHGDHHDLWLDPQNPERMIIGDDGGAQISKNAGKSFSTYLNQPTAQFYRVSTDNHFPYRLYAGQQDNSSLRISSQDQSEWEPTAGGESGHIVADPKNNDIVYGGSYDGFLMRYNHKTGETRLVDVYPDNPMGWGAAELKYRFQWNFPIFFSPNDENILYTAANVLFKTTNEGQNWEAISPDLTRNDKTKMQSSGGEITKDNTSVEYYGTIFAAAESPAEKGVIWTGSDDGLIHITKDGGKNWENITPTNLPEWAMINSIDLHPTKKGVAYVAATRYKSDDFTPYLYKTKDYGKTWTKITNGIPKDDFTRVLRLDPVRDGLLYAGTESSVYISFDDGQNWQPMRYNLPIVPITDMQVKENDLIVSTQGRSFWIFDDLNPIRNFDNQKVEKLKTDNFLAFAPSDTYLSDRNMEMYFYLNEKPDTSKILEIEILDKNGNLIQKYSSDAKATKDKDSEIKSLKAEKGANTFKWNMRYPDAKKFEGMILWFGGTQGVEAMPDDYKVKVTFRGKTQEVDFKLLKDPRWSVSDADLKERFKFLKEIRDKLTETHEAIINIRKMRSDLNDWKAKAKENKEWKEVAESADKIIKELTKIEETLYQTQNRSGQDPLNFPVRLNNKLSALATTVGYGNFPPTEGAKEVKKDITEKIDEQLKMYYNILKTDIPAFNKLVAEKNIPAISVGE
ncbi:WD40/YVTN/BNR-like repeat-containing protein [Bernardetia sp.]|uniref:WD40/YVTN/BNR-like repeat-containing protein n=1 Tax=Bernardetia sp. TaxID=1937974 RepID=UPI0025B91EE4|nr:glycosyl hydrolase [Bernardetia sp.]